MKFNFIKYGQYKNDIFNKMDISFARGGKLLDVGCGDGSDAKIFINEFNLDTFGIDVFEHENIKKIKSLKFKKAGIYKIPFEDSAFDYVFLHDVLHHIDEKSQDYNNHIKGLQELKRVCKKDGQIIILEANRYNPLFYLHMVLMCGHNHFTQKYFQKIVKDIFGGNADFKTFESHFYPKKLLRFFKVIEKISERVPFFNPFRSYNLAIIKNDKQ